MRQEGQFKKKDTEVVLSVFKQEKIQITQIFIEIFIPNCWEGLR